MWRLIKTEVFYRFWQPAAYYLILYLFGSIFAYALLNEPPVRGGSNETVIIFALFALMWPWMISLTLLNREFKEQRLRLTMLLPLSLKQIATARLTSWLLLNSMLIFILIPLSFMARIPLWSGQFLFLLIAVPVYSLPFSLYNRLMPELQYLASLRAKIGMVVVYFSMIVIFIPLIMFKPPLHYFRWLSSYPGIIVGLALGIYLFFVNRNVFMRRTDYSRMHKPETNIFDFIRSWRGIHSYQR